MNLSYLQPLMNTIRKVYITPDPRSQEYQRLEAQLQKILSINDKEKITQALRETLSSLKRKKETSSIREEERIASILHLLDPLKFSPKSILDIGAGTGDIISALKSWYKLPLSSVFAIDNKLPQIIDVTTLTYDNGRIPLLSGSVELVILFVVLHHIPSEQRQLIISEISRVLTSNGVVIIREHDDRGDEDFRSFIDIIHLFWYVASNEAQDPLFLMTRTETQNLLKKGNLVPISYSSYPSPNPQRLYHELYMKKGTGTIYRFENEATQHTVQQYIDNLLEIPHNYSSLVDSIPAKLHKNLTTKYMSYIPSNMDVVWADIVQDAVLEIILESIKYATQDGASFVITSEAFNNSVSELS